MLEKELRAQGGAAGGVRPAHCRRPRSALKSAWIDAVVRLMNASAVTGSAMADVKWAPPGAPVPALAAGLCLPKLPPLPEIGEGAPTPCQISQNKPQAEFRTRTEA